MIDEKIALKPYLETFKSECIQLSKQELTDIILGLAKEEISSDRMIFLNKFKSLLPASISNKLNVRDINEVLDAIQALTDSISDRIELIENGDYDELDDWDWDTVDYDDEPEYISDEQYDNLESMFEYAAYLFLNGELEGSKCLYEALFTLIGKLNASEYVLPEPDLDLDIREERARYARCIYETFDKNNRLDNFAIAMNLDGNNRFNNLRVSESYPLVQDVMNTMEKEMPGLQSFFLSWKKLLCTKGINGRVASLITEVVYYLEGFKGIENLSRKWGNDQPYGYLFWLSKLKEENKALDIIDVSQEALDLIEIGDTREEISIFLIEAGDLLNSVDHVLIGKQEKFFSNPCDENLLQLLNTAIKSNNRKQVLERTLSFFDHKNGKSDDEKSLQLKCLLMAGRLDDALNMVKPYNHLGWSYGLNIGLVFGAVSVVLSNYDEDAVTVKRILKEYAEKKIGFLFHTHNTDENLAITFYDEIIKSVKQIQFPELILQNYRNWVFKIGCARVDGIVSKTHRNAYGRAASVLGTLAEIHASNGDFKKAKTLIHEYCKKKYNRHIAFKREVKSVIECSDLLDGIYI